MIIPEEHEQDINAWDGPHSDGGMADGIEPENFPDMIDQLEGTRSDRAGETGEDRETGLEDFMAGNPDLDETDDWDV